uniref:BTB domain-containing protein n=1 Tax=Denticeps clupeoides TaxID=299321 RepID=A0AAY4AN22_9TELE
MVLIAGRRVNWDSSSAGARELPAVKRKVCEIDSKHLNGYKASFDFYPGSSHSESVLQVFNEFRDSRLFTDVVISVEGREFPCHRAVLSACSSYFRAMFCNDHRESREMLVEINGIRAEAMDTFLQYVYTGRASITTTNVQSVFETSSLFQILTLRDACAKFLEEQLDPCNCLGFRRFANTHCLNQLSNSCRTYALQNFEEVIQHEEFLDLYKEELEEYMASDELTIGKEEMVFEAAMLWVCHRESERKSMLKDLLQHVRLPLLHPNYFVQTVEGNQLIQVAPECYHLLHEARRYHVLGNEMMSPRTRPRRYEYKISIFQYFFGKVYRWNAVKCGGQVKQLNITKTKIEVKCLAQCLLDVSGGRINSRDVWMYNSQLNLWIRVASLNKGRWCHKMAAVLGKVYVLGGYDGQCRLTSVESYDSFSNRWTEVAPMKQAVSSPAVVSCAGKLFVIGGVPENNGFSNKVQCYDPDTNSWTLKSDIPIAKPNITAVSFNNLIYVTGGLTKAIYCHDPAVDSWMHVANTFSKLESCSMSVCGGKIYILGGRGETGEATDTILCYDPSAGIITGMAALRRSLSYVGCVTIHRYNENLTCS